MPRLLPVAESSSSYARKDPGPNPVSKRDSPAVLHRVWRAGKDRCPPASRKVLTHLESSAGVAWSSQPSTWEVPPGTPPCATVEDRARSEHFRMPAVTHLCSLAPAWQSPNALCIAR